MPIEPSFAPTIAVALIVLVLAGIIIWLAISNTRHDERNASRAPAAPINFWTIDQKLDTLLGDQTAMSKEMDDLKTAVETKVKALTDENTALKADVADHASDKQKATDLATELAK